MDEITPKTPANFDDVGNFVCLNLSTLHSATSPRLLLLSIALSQSPRPPRGQTDAIG